MHSLIIRLPVLTTSAALAKKRPEPRVYRGPGLYSTELNFEMVEVGGVEPPSESTPSPVLHA